MKETNNTVKQIDFILDKIRHDLNITAGTMKRILQIQPEITIFTPEQLARFNGKNGNPAYIAVNGTVYDVTNNAAWAAATHFGLTTGQDLSDEFASCHPGQPILNNLRVVGKLVQNE
ncbi:cytochrome b5 domain-containing protein [Phosphitispora sp. TUW77]|uniref:cytochrome b5 domain-containing protein n=1 Tax=Phosphitispora sp. TUW77 TaxID=3152361 RepID=UPI003AB152D6